MITRLTRRALPAFRMVLTAALVLAAADALAGDARAAYYCADNTRLFWFVHVADPHIGTSGSEDSSRLRWVVTTGRSVIDPAFIVATGDLTDSTNGNIFGFPNGPHQAEWDEYASILAAAGAGANVFYDLPGNHDAYSDASFAYYRANAVQGRATGGTQVSWVREFPFGKYHFLGVNTADNSGDPFSLFWPYGDYAGLDTAELDFVDRELALHPDADLTLVFGHHPVTDTGSSGDTWLFYGHQEFIQRLDLSGASLYGYGHTHEASSVLFAGNGYTGAMPNGGVHYLNVASLGKSSGSNYAVLAVDCNGLSAAIQTVGTWPAVLVTAPTSARLGTAVNPYAYTVPRVAANPVRALVFDANPVTAVRFRIDGATTWSPMARAVEGSPVWAGTWDASTLSLGLHTLEVQAVGSSTRSHIISVEVTDAANRPPVAAGDSYTTASGASLTVTKPGVLGNDVDEDGDALTAKVGVGVSHGTLTLAADGAFTYVPASGYFGPDTFTYVAHDGTAASNVATVALTVTAPATDTVSVRSATYTARKQTLTVEATSSAQPAAKLSVYGPDLTPFGAMQYQTKTKKYVLSVVIAAPPPSVTVKSDMGGIATKVVTTK